MKRAFSGDDQIAIATKNGEKTIRNLPYAFNNHWLSTPYKTVDFCPFCVWKGCREVSWSYKQDIFNLFHRYLTDVTVVFLECQTVSFSFISMFDILSCSAILPFALSWKSSSQRCCMTGKQVQYHAKQRQNIIKKIHKQLMFKQLKHPIHNCCTAYNGNYRNV